jgi:hypothetical protein
MNFNQWLLLNENVETNFNDWLETLIQYAKPSDWNIVADSFYAFPRHNNSSPGVHDYLRELVGKDRKQWTGHHRDLIRSSTFIKENVKSVIKTVLKEKNLENFNWFSFSIGYLGAKNNYFKEDLELAIDVTKQRIDNRELPKTEIGAKGWLRIGYEAKDKVQEYLQSQQQVSNRQLEKMKKSGMSLGENENLIKLAVGEGNIKIYHLPALKSVDNVKERHLLLCKYGKGTDWCTAQPSWDAHTGYTGDTIYIIHIDDKPAYQFVSCTDGRNKQFMDTRDQYVDELNGDVYDALIANLNDQFKCYRIKRKTSLKDLLELDSKKREIIYNAISKDDFLELIKLANAEQKNKILKDDKSNYLKFTNFFDQLNLTLVTTKITNVKELIENLSGRSFKIKDMPLINFSRDEIENFINKNVSLIVWKYYRELRFATHPHLVGNNLLEIFGKENVQKEYPALKIIKPEHYFKDTWNPDETGKKPRVSDSSILPVNTEGNAPSIERILSSHALYDGDKKLSTIEAIEKVGAENLNFQNKHTSFMRRILFMSKDFDEILNYFKEKNLIEKVEEFVNNMNEIDVDHITEYYFENDFTVRTLDEFRKQDFYKVLKYLHETADLNNLMRKRGINGIIDDYYNYSNDSEPKPTNGVFEQGVFEIVGEKNFKISWYNDFKIAKRLIFSNKTDSKLFDYLKNKETVAKDPRNNSYHRDNWDWFFEGTNKGDPHTLELLDFVVEKMPDNDNLTYAFLIHGNLDKELIDKHEAFTKRILEKYGKGVGTVDENGVFTYNPETRHATIMIDQENLKYAWKKYLGITIKDFNDKDKRLLKL